jgi:peptidoglycan/LPS O-acetylase OafA/YrhL
MFLIPFSGNAAVYCFFVISGFYMSLILNEKYLGAGAAWRFYTNRILRLLPTYLVVLAVVASYRAFAHAEQFHFLVDSSINLLNRGLVVFANFTNIGIDHYRYSYEQMGLPNIEDWRLIPQAWSLEPELIFYAIAPFVLRRLNVRKALVFFGVDLILFANQPQIEATGCGFYFLNIWSSLLRDPSAISGTSGCLRG